MQNLLKSQCSGHVQKSNSSRHTVGECFLVSHTFKANCFILTEKKVLLSYRKRVVVLRQGTLHFLVSSQLSVIVVQSNLFVNVGDYEILRHHIKFFKGKGETDKQMLMPIVTKTNALR